MIHCIILLIFIDLNVIHKKIHRDEITVDSTNIFQFKLRNKLRAKPIQIVIETTKTNTSLPSKQKKKKKKNEF